MRLRLRQYLASLSGPGWNIQGRFRPRLERLEERTLLNAGAPDPTFGTQGNSVTPYGVVTTQLQGADSAEAVAIQPDGKIVVAGSSAHPLAPTVAEYGIVRYSTASTLDKTFGTNGIVLGSAGENITAIAVAANGAIIASGTANLGAVVFEFNSNGTPNASFGANGIVTVDGSAGSEAEGILLQPNGKIVGVLEDQSAMTARVFRLNADGTPDSSFVSPNIPATFGGPLSMALAPDGKIVFGGVGTSNPTITIYRLNPDGNQDPAFVGGHGSLQVPNEAPTAAFGLAVQADGRLVVADTVSNGTMESPSAGIDVRRYNLNGTPDVTFNGNGDNDQIPLGDSAPASVLIQRDDRIVVVGTSFTVFPLGGIPSVLALARLNPNGSLDSTFGSNGTTIMTVTGPSGATLPNAIAAAATLQPDGKIVVAGSWATTSGMDFLTARFLGDIPTGTSHQQFVSQVYLDLLQRPVDAAGLSYWSGLLDSGQETAQQVAMGIERSAEYEQLVVNQLYGEYLHRAADPGGLAGWTSFLASGGTEDQLRAVLLGSAEYYTVSGSSANGFVASVYIDVLERPVDPGGAQAWSQLLADGATRTAVAAAIIRSTEGNNVEVTDLYFWLLHRAPDAFGLQLFTQDLAQGVPAEAIVAAMIGSPEYASTRV
jgi:uncharacterized delta-60 repeat protein